MNKALEGVTVLDFSHLLQGPFATQMLGDLGANIIKIERNETGELFRSLTFFNEWVGGSESPNFLAWNRNKRSIALNLKSPEVHAVIMEMAKQADIVVQNFRPGVLDRLGYGYEDFKLVNPKIIYCSGSGYGESGPYVTRPGQDMLIQGLVGVANNTGTKSQPPVPVGSGFSDQVGAMNMVYSILSALFYRERTGKGQKVEVNLLAGMMAHLNQEYVTVLNLKRDFERPESGIGHPGMDAPFGIYQTSDGFISIAMSPFMTLVDTLEAPHLEKYNDPQLLFDKRDEVWASINSETVRYTTEVLLDKLLTADVWAAKVQDFRSASTDPQVQHLGMITSYEHPKAGEVKVVAPAIKMSETPPSIERPAPLVGQHGKEILQEFGFSQDTINDLLSKQLMSIDEGGSDDIL
ncbi:putative ALPHA METHYLACYL-COA RACEMASE [Vibrio nigripulchritudo SFn27]|uniref:Formyl-CoA transferase n=1 Tax=Vibrio nigripulchritudo TaxID=28173 RepID=A0A9P1JLD7_9VIBR|nr:CaiB/BaiF CoA-transferase family protein [Vibrio nigripulchritudo]CBJ93074.1 Putative Formyl-CoA transferase [Vibrio nigripulchritudo]CCN85885.1 putative ALPHA METHYLACYL-COA RACEMASE [Vibrio nigripulchritudo BLFn1]CCN91876.1 putative ALPHA METHYLACYL-COA RACEMASE [Vibrio nigripulchritudo SFn27]CCN97682.1 putative ALPHA METHYLACYL-COA RACEMASE [Vibrio nigripulchritudo ENn2]CCO43913.1 putative ALPHA METHYLACYL-COA RACEMASE [Vibrio nigripulchritudo SFn135]